MTRRVQQTALAAASALALATGLVACGSSSATDASSTASPDAAATTAADASTTTTAAPAMMAAATSAAAPSAGAKSVKVRIVTTDGPIVVVLDPVHAPKTVANFLHYVDGKFYDGGTFFRAIPGFVIQGGDKAREKPTDPTVPLEDSTTTGIKNLNGSIAMARTSDPNSATSEFFIDDGPQPSLDGSPSSPGYAAFGTVTSGMDVVRKIARLPAQSEYLLTPVKIVKVERVH
jgi:peptidyl-prolyl cis-trans isomerase A (cyclophilin A)